jgi:phosphoglycolate phosphatase-like HAD superfamily hydrolase
VSGLLLDLDRVLGDTRPLWDAFVADLRRRTRIELDLPHDRAAAALALDRTAGNWRALLVRFAEDHAPIHLRPDPKVNAALRRARAGGTRVDAFTDAPPELAEIALRQLGVARLVAAVEAGQAAPQRLLERVGGDGRVIRSRDELLRAAT